MIVCTHCIMVDIEEFQIFIKNIVSFTYFAIMEDLDKNVFFCQNWEHIYTLIVDVDIDRILIFKTQGILPF